MEDAALLSQLDIATWASGHDGALADDLIAGLVPFLTTVFAFNTAAQGFYERQGGKRLGEQAAFEWRGEPVREYVYGFGDDVHAY